MAGRALDSILNKAIAEIARKVGKKVRVLIIAAHLVTFIDDPVPADPHPPLAVLLAQKQHLVV